MALIDISQKLEIEEDSKIKIDSEHEYNVDCGAETMLIAQQKFEKSATVEDFYEIIKLFIGKDALKLIKSKNLSVKKLSIVVIAVMAQVNEVSYEEMEKRFRKFTGK